MSSYTIKQFLNREYNKEPWYKSLRIKKRHVVALSIGLGCFLFNSVWHIYPLTVSSFLFNQIFYFDNPVDTMSITKRVTKAFEPLIVLISSLAYPLASLLVVYGSILFMLGRNDKGTDIMFKAALGYVLLKISPQLLDILIEIIDTIDLRD